MSLPYETEVRQFSHDIEYALITTTTSCSFSLPTAMNTQLESNSAYETAFNISSYTKFNLRGLRIAIPFAENQFRIQPVSTRAVRVKFTHDCRQERYSERVCDIYCREVTMYRQVCSYTDFFADSIATDHIFATTSGTPFIDIFWNKTNAITVSESITLNVQYTFTLPEDFTKTPMISEISDDYFIESANNYVQVHVQGKAPLQGIFYSEYVDDGNEVELDELLDMNHGDADSYVDSYGNTDYSDWWGNGKK